MMAVIKRLIVFVLVSYLLLTGVLSHDNVLFNCLPSRMDFKFITAYPFYGKIFSYNTTSSVCRTFGSGTFETNLLLPIQSVDCNVKEEMPDVFSAIVVIQHHPLVQQRGDRRLKLSCDFRLTNQTVSSGFNAVFERTSAGGVVNSSAPSPNVRFRVLDKSGVDVTDTRLGEELYLRVDIDDNSIFAMAPRSLVASSGSTNEYIVLLNDLGCPVDDVIFSGLNAFHDSRFLQGRFQAFKFANDAIVRFHLNVQFCVHQCPQVPCRHANKVEESASRQRRHDWMQMPLNHLMMTRELSDPLLPLQKEIIVNGAATVRKLPFPPTSSSTAMSDTDGDEDFMCLSKTMTILIGICLVLFHICVISTCVICIWVSRHYRVAASSDDDTHSVLSADDRGEATTFRAAIKPAARALGGHRLANSVFYSDRLNTKL